MDVVLVCLWRCAHVLGWETWASRLAYSWVLRSAYACRGHGECRGKATCYLCICTTSPFRRGAIKQVICDGQNRLRTLACSRGGKPRASRKRVLGGADWEKWDGGMGGGGRVGDRWVGVLAPRPHGHGDACMLGEHEFLGLRNGKGVVGCGHVHVCMTEREPDCGQMKDWVVLFMGAACGFGAGTRARMPHAASPHCASGFRTN